ncbi:MAG: nucleoside phosphorylase [Anaerolineales bacterium]
MKVAMSREQTPHRNGGSPNQPGVSAPFTASDLPIDDEGRIYHLQVGPGDIAPDILLVGDPGRAELIGDGFLGDIELAHEHRGLATVTGTARSTGRQATIISPLRTTVTTSGMGPPSLEIVANELVALNEIDLNTRKRKAEYQRLHIIRVGSSGSLQASTALGTPIITTYAIGLDNTGLFYEAPYPDETCERLERELGRLFTGSMNADSRFHGKIRPYVSRAEPNVVRALVEASARLGVNTKQGLTVSAPGFFLPQGRPISRMEPSIPDVDKVLGEFDPHVDGQCIENMEMETSFLTHFLGGLGYWAGAICPAIANRREDTFTCTYQEAMEDAIRVALLALASLRSDRAQPMLADGMQA